MEIIPDEIYVNITLREYQKRGENKKDIETIKTTFLENCKAVGLPDSVISIFPSQDIIIITLLKKERKTPICNLPLLTR
jgi:hypothetical protein